MCLSLALLDGSEKKNIANDVLSGLRNGSLHRSNTWIPDDALNVTFLARSVDQSTSLFPQNSSWSAFLYSKYGTTVISIRFFQSLVEWQMVGQVVYSASIQ